MSEQSCPSCGAPLEQRSRGAIVVVCAYCDSTLLRQSQNLELIGKMAQLQEDGSPIQLEVRGTFRQRRFQVVGRIQLEYDRGFWNEWYLTFDDGSDGWLGEGQGQYRITHRVEDTPALPHFDHLRTQQPITIRGNKYWVQEISKAKCIAGAGELPFEVGVGYEAGLADLSAPDRAVATIDYSENPPLVFVGRMVEFDELSFSGLRKFEGW